jgi:adenylosuccinate synthase
MGRPLGNLAVLGLQWGDEGKGKLVDLLGAAFRNIVRFQGGNNAGHTVVVGGESIALHQVPSGALHPSCFLVVGSGVVLNLEVLHQELDRLRTKGLDVLGRLLLSDRAHIILPYHIALDNWREGGANRIGTTGRGIGPAYEMKAARLGVRLGDTKAPESLLGKVSDVHGETKRMMGDAAPLPEPAAVFEKIKELAAPLHNGIGDTQEYLHRAWKNGEPILFEGAQATMLDIDHGTYPFVTSSNCSIGGLFAGTGLPPKAVHSVLGVTKAYATRVGAGPFPSELDDPIGDGIRASGREFGTTTGRPRRCGWLDAVLLRHACRLNGADCLGIMKLDVLDNLDRVGLVKAYRTKDGAPLTAPPPTAEGWKDIVPVVEYFDGWPRPTKGIKSWDALPTEAKTYLGAIEDAAETPIAYVSTGPDRDEGLLAHGSCLRGLIGV